MKVTCSKCGTEQEIMDPAPDLLEAPGGVVWECSFAVEADTPGVFNRCATKNAISAAGAVEVGSLGMEGGVSIG